MKIKLILKHFINHFNLFNSDIILIVRYLITQLSYYEVMVEHFSFVIKYFLLYRRKWIAISNDHTIVIAEKLMMGANRSSSCSSISSWNLISWPCLLHLLNILVLWINCTNCRRCMHHMVSILICCSLLLLLLLIKLIISNNLCILRSAWLL